MKLFSDKSYLLKDLDAEEVGVVLLAPLWGETFENSEGHPYRNRYVHWFKEAKELFELVPIQNSDIAVFPSQWITKKHYKHAYGKKVFESFLELAQRYGKKTILFFQHDSDESIPYHDVLVLRCSLYASKKKTNEIAIPYWSADIIDECCGGNLPLREKKDCPTIGFCGYAGKKINITSIQGGIELFKKIVKGKQAGHSERRQALSLLEKSQNISCNFIIRDRMWEGFSATTKADQVQNSYSQYVQNIINSDYTLCSRGNGNYSIRLYETLCCGRVPVFINTDCSLPFAEIAPWRDYFVWVESKDIKQIESKILEHYNRFTNAQFVELQRECRRLWEKYLSPSGFFRTLVGILPGFLNEKNT